MGKTCSEKASSFNQKEKKKESTGYVHFFMKVLSCCNPHNCIKKIFFFFYHAVAFILLNFLALQWLTGCKTPSYLLTHWISCFQPTATVSPLNFTLSTPSPPPHSTHPFLASCIHTPCLQSQLLFVTLYWILDPVLNHCGAILFPLHWFTNCIGANPETLQPHRKLGHTCGTSTSGHCRKAVMWTF